MPARVDNEGYFALIYLDHEEIGIDEVIRKSGLPTSAVSVALLSLEMKRLIRQWPTIANRRPIGASTEAAKLGARSIGRQYLK